MNMFVHGNFYERNAGCTPGCTSYAGCMHPSCEPGFRSLPVRRLHQQLIFTYKLIFGLVDLHGIAVGFSLSAQMKQHEDMLANCLHVTVV